MNNICDLTVRTFTTCMAKNRKYVYVKMTAVRVVAMMDTGSTSLNGIHPAGYNAQHRILMMHIITASRICENR